MNIFKLSYLMIPLVATLSACGSSSDEHSFPSPSSSALVKSISLEQVALEHSAKWHALGDASTSNLTRVLNNNTLAETPIKLASAQNADSADGVLMHLDSMPLDWRAKIKQALHSGQSVVIESAGTDDSIIRLQEITLDLTGSAISAAAVMIVPNEVGTEIYSVSAFEFEQISDLVKSMTLVYKRSNLSV